MRPELVRMGANIEVHGGTATVTGVETSERRAGDGDGFARFGLADPWRGWRLKGETTVSRVYHLDRGYEHVVRKLEGVGAKIERIKGQ